ncbi:MAG: hypothetical protein ACETWD_03040, partial [Desulfatiglandales bacterium]
RKDVKRFVNDPDFDRVIPRAWCFKPFLHIPLAFLILSISVGLLYFLLERETFASVVVVLLTLVVMGGIPAIIWLNSRDWFSASTINQVWDRANMLHRYLQDYIDLNPVLASRIRRKDEQRLERQLEDLHSHNLELEEELEEMEHELKHLKQRLASFETPSQYEVSQQVLDKLDPLEQTRLLEAIQAYRVNAWTPAAAVCGMILEGRLQRLCRKNGIRPGGIGAMIRRLGEAGLLKSYYQNLAQVGEFFRHRATHPTSEEFDREKTTLVLTSLIILVRDLF